MIPGEVFTCPSCGEKSVAKTKAKLDGWTQVGTVLVCALCGAEIEPLEATEKSNVDRKKLDSLATLLGTEIPPQETLNKNGSEAHFCRTCVNFITHPFRMICGLDGHEIDPMGECKKYRKSAPHPK